MRCETARTVDFIHGDAPDSLQREEKRKTLKKDPDEKDRKLKMCTWFLSIRIFRESGE